MAECNWTETTITRLAEPSCIKVERNSKGWNYEITQHAADLDSCIEPILAAKKRLEEELGIVQKPAGGAV